MAEFRERQNSETPGMMARVRVSIGVWLVSAMLATATDLSLSATHGYSLRLDQALLLLWDFAGLFVATGAVLVTIAIARRIVRRLPPMRVAECLLAALAPIATLTLRHHHERHIVAAFAAIA